MRKKKFICLIIFFIFLLVQSVKAKEGLVGWWKFDEGTGDILHDSSGKNNHGKIHGATWVKGNTSFALLFDGKDDFVFCGNDDSVHLDGSFTVSSWIIVPTGLLFKDHMIVSKGCWSVKIQGKKDDTSITNVAIETIGEEGWGRWNQFNHIKCPVYEWVHIVIVHSLEEKKINLYINGELSYQLEWLDTSIFAYDKYPLVFGRHSADFHSYFYGFISETRIYNKALSLEQIKSNYQLEIKTKDKSISFPEVAK